MCRDSVLPIDLFEGKGVQHVTHLLFCGKEAAHTIHSSVLHHQLQLIRQAQFLLRFGTVLFAEIVPFSSSYVLRNFGMVDSTADHRCQGIGFASLRVLDSDALLR